MGSKRHAPVNKLFAWVRRQSAKVKTFLVVVCVLSALVALKLLVHDHNHFYVVSEATHFAGILVLIYRLTTRKTCSGIVRSSTDFIVLIDVYSRSSLNFGFKCLVE